MHIPKSDTQHTEILTFEEAQKHREESAVYDREKWLYIPDFYSEYRYILGTAGKKPLITIGINPSTAEPDNLDNTLKSVERIALFNGFESHRSAASPSSDLPSFSPGKMLSDTSQLQKPQLGREDSHDCSVVRTS